MKKIAKFSILILTAVICFNCSSSDDGGDTNGGDPEPNPNPNKITTYDADVKAIIDGQCIRCHTTPLQEGATFPMDNFNETRNGINRGMIERIQSTSSRRVMPPPPAAMLTQEVIDIIRDWEADGLLEN